jgi:hypothetical protein
MLLLLPLLSTDLLKRWDAGLLSHLVVAVVAVVVVA